MRSFPVIWKFSIRCSKPLILRSANRRALSSWTLHLFSLSASKPSTDRPNSSKIASAHLRACSGAAVELTKLARLLPAALTAPLEPQHLGDAVARANSLLLVEAKDIDAYQVNAARSLRPVSQARMPLASIFTIVRNEVHGAMYASTSAAGI